MHDLGGHHEAAEKWPVCPYIPLNVTFSNERKVKMSEKSFASSAFFWSTRARESMMSWPDLLGCVQVVLCSGSSWKGPRQGHPIRSNRQFTNLKMQTVGHRTHAHCIWHSYESILATYLQLPPPCCNGNMLYMTYRIQHSHTTLK